MSGTTSTAEAVPKTVGGPSVAAVVVTYNRKALLEQTLQSLRAQVYRIDRIIVVDNYSTDGTRDALARIDDPRFDVVLLDRNTGGAGGFATGIERAYREGYELIWVMDDDILAEPDALEALLQALNRLRKGGAHPNFLACNIINLSGEPVNSPVLDLRVQANGNMHWAKFLQDGIVPIVSTSFVGTLITRKAVANYGLPIAEMFIWGDDTEYTFRMTKEREAAYIVGAARIVHFGRAVELSILREPDRERANNFFYFYRNMVYTQLRYGTRQAKAAFCLKLMRDFLKLLLSLRWSYLRILLSGLAHGVFFRPRISIIEDGNSVAASHSRGHPSQAERDNQ